MSKNYEINVLFDGYSIKTANGMGANCTCTLLKGPSNIIIDTMTAWDGPRILSKLKEHSVDPKDVSFVISTHGHSDHIGNNNLFLNATHIVGYAVSKNTFYFDHDFTSGQEYVVDEFIKVIPTPGHTATDVSVLARVNNSVYAIVGDLFERKEDIFDESLWKDTAGSENPDLQRKNRKAVIQVADYIIPGHGPMFKVDDKLRKAV